MAHYRTVPGIDFETEGRAQSDSVYKYTSHVFLHILLPGKDSEAMMGNYHLNIS